MFTSGPDYNLTLYIQAIIWFILVGYLINLIIKNKLTYVDEFRRNTVAGIFLKFILICGLLIFQIVFQLPKEILWLPYVFMSSGIVGFVILTQIGISKLIKHIRSIIDFETKNRMNIAILSSAIITTILSILFSIPRLNDPDVTQQFMLYMFTILNFFFYFATIYTLLLHREMRNIDLNILLYLGLCYLCFGLALFPSIFIEARTDLLFWVNVLVYLIIVNIVLILGYLDFKNKISRGLAK